MTTKHGHHTDKGAFQLSLGLIVVIVFAIVLLSLALTWLRAMIESIMGLTDNLVQQARLNLEETFRTTAKTFDIYPARWDMIAGKTLIMSAGVKNTHSDGQTHDFVINVIPLAASNDVCPSGDINTCPPPSGSTASSLKAYMETWVTFPKSPIQVQINGKGYFDVTIKAPGESLAGDYMFRFLACIDVASSSACTINTWGEAPQQLTMTITR